MVQLRVSILASSSLVIEESPFINPTDNHRKRLRRCHMPATTSEHPLLGLLVGNTLRSSSSSFRRGREAGARSRRRCSHPSTPVNQAKPQAKQCIPAIICSRRLPKHPRPAIPSEPPRRLTRTRLFTSTLSLLRRRSNSPPPRALIRISHTRTFRSLCSLTSRLYPRHPHLSLHSQHRIINLLSSRLSSSLNSRTGNTLRHNRPLSLQYGKLSRMRSTADTIKNRFPPLRTTPRNSLL